MLQGERVVLRPVQAWDRERLYELVETIEIRALASGKPPLPLSLEEVEARDKRWIEERDENSAWFAIDVDAELIGICGLHSLDHYQQLAEVGIRLGKDHWGKGFGQDAVRTLVDYGFRHLNLAKISLRVLADDERAVGSYRKVGFVEEGRLRAHAWYDGSRHDELFMSVFREEWEPRNPSASTA
jgi:RimJ/RimL family protein N-acetyltransferase